MMKWRLCQCEVNGLVRPKTGNVRVKSTDMKDKDLLQAKLEGGGTVHVIRVRGHYFYQGPNKEIREVPADTLTDGLHAAIFMENLELTEKKKLPHKKRPMPHVSVKKFKKI